MMLFEIPDLKVVSEANLREHWAEKARRAKAQREAAGLMMASMGIHHGRPKPPLAITLTRIAPRTLDSDNLARSMKAVRDGIADALGVDDGDERITWVYGQRRGAPKTYAVEVKIEQRGERKERT